MKDKKYLVLVNREYSIKNEKEYEKVVCNSIYKKDIFLEKETYEAFLKLQEFIKENGYDIEIESGYRSYSYQQRIWDECVNNKGLEHTKKYVAEPGHSEHQTGLAVDYLLYENGLFYEEHKIKDKPVVELILLNAYKFGFILRYPKGKEDITGYAYEPWHLRFIKDKKIAKYIYDNNLCLEEYIGLH